MVTALAIFCFVIDHIIDDFDFPYRQITLVIGRVIPGIPKTEFDGGENGQVCELLAVIYERQLPDFQALSKGHKISDLGFDAIKFGSDDRIAQTVTTFILFKWVTGRLPSR